MARVRRGWVDAPQAGMRQRRAGTRGLEGALAGALALAALWMASRVTAAIPFPPLSLAGQLIRLAPGDVATFFIERLQHNAVRLLEAGVTVAVLVAAALLPRLVSRSGDPVRASRAGALLAVGLVLAALLDPVRRSTAGLIAAGAAAGLLYAAALALLAAPAATAGRATLLSRREALAWIGWAIGGFVAGGAVLGRLLARTEPDTGVALAAPAERAVVPDRAAFPAISGLSPEVTAARDHYVVDIDIVDPVVEADGWALAIRGEVEQPLEWSFAKLQRSFPVVEAWSVLTCVSNEVGGDLVGNSKWTGVRIRDVLRAAGLRPRAVDVVFVCADGYTVSVPVRAAMHPSALLAVAQNGRPLTQAHGFPCRARLPALYGMMNAKWLQAIEVVRFDAKGYWARRGWSDVGTVRTGSRIDTAGSGRASESRWVAGVAWAGLRGISRVEVSLDGGKSWAAARLREPLSPVAWTQWAYRWTPPRPGPYRVLCRAADGDGRVQDAARRRPHPSGASGYHQVGVIVS